MPTPNKGESKKDYLKRCVPMVIHEKTAKDGKQGYAICNSMWDQHKKNKKSRAEEIVEGVQKSLLEVTNEKRN